MKINSVLSSGGFSGKVNTTRLTAERTNSKLNSVKEIDQQNTSADLSNLSGVEDSTRRLDAVKINSFFNQAASALNSIVDLREEQLALATKAKNEIREDKRETLNTEFSAIQTEIERVASQAQSDALNSVQGVAVFDVSSTIDDFSKVTGKGDTSSLATDQSLSLTTQTSASTAKDSLDGLLKVTRTARTDAEAAADQSEQDIEELIEIERAQREQSPDSISSAEQAQELVGEITDKLLSNSSESPNTIVNGGESSQFLINNLDPDRVEELLKG